MNPIYITDPGQVESILAGTWVAPNGKPAMCINGNPQVYADLLYKVLAADGRFAVKSGVGLVVLSGLENPRWMRPSGVTIKEIVLANFQLAKRIERSLIKLIDEIPPSYFLPNLMRGQYLLPDRIAWFGGLVS